MLEGIAPGAADEVGAQQHEDLVDRHIAGNVSRDCDGDVGRQDQQVAAKRGPESQPEHGVEVEGRKQQPRGHQRQLLGSRLGRHENGAEAEQGSRDLYAGLIPAAVEALDGEQQNDQHERQLQAEPHHVRLRKMWADQHPVIDHGEAEHGGQRDEYAHAYPPPRSRAVAQEKFGFEIAGEPQAQPSPSCWFDCRTALRSRVSQPTVQCRKRGLRS